MKTRVRVIAGLHLLAVVAIYGVALVVGGGLSGPPFPAESRRPGVSAEAVLTALPPRGLAEPEWTAATVLHRPADEPARTVSDLRAPWSFDPDGRLRLNTD